MRKVLLITALGLAGTMVFFACDGGQESELLSPDRPLLLQGNNCPTDASTFTVELSSSAVGDTYYTNDDCSTSGEPGWEAWVADGHAQIEPYSDGETMFGCAQVFDDCYEVASDTSQPFATYPLQSVRRRGGSCQSSQNDNSQFVRVRYDASWECCNDDQCGTPDDICRMSDHQCVECLDNSDCVTGTLTVDLQGSTQILPDQECTWTADASTTKSCNSGSCDTNTVTYAWYYDGSYDTGGTGSAYSTYTGGVKSGDLDDEFVLKVIVSADGQSPASDQVLVQENAMARPCSGGGW